MPSSSACSAFSCCFYLTTMDLWHRNTSAFMIFCWLAWTDWGSSEGSFWMREDRPMTKRLISKSCFTCPCTSPNTRSRKFYVQPSCSRDMRAAEVLYQRHMLMPWASMHL